MARFALVGAEVFDGEARHSDAAVVVADGRIRSVGPAAALPPDLPRTDLGGGLLAPGFVDIQVNGGGGVLFNETPSVDGIRRIAAAHAPFGTTAMLPTVITDRPEVTFAAIEAARQAVAAGVPGCLGIHVEGPFLSPARKGAHDPALIRTLTDGDVEALAGTAVRPLLLTVAAENAAPTRIRRLTEAGIHVSVGHSDADFATVRAAFEAGARGVTHLFNAMSGLGSREPGVVGAALDRGGAWCGIIADGFHVHPAVIAAAIRGKRGPGRLVAITDAMPTVGSPEDTFRLNGRTVTRDNGRLTLEDGTLAGSDLSMIGAVRFLVEAVGVELEEALRMASLYPAQFLGVDGTHGRLGVGARADMVHLGDDLSVRSVWIGGIASFGMIAPG